MNEQQQVSRTLYALLETAHRIEEIEQAMPAVAHNVLRKALDDLIAQGLVYKNKKNRYAQAEHYGRRTGIFHVVNRHFAVCQPDHAAPSRELELYIPQGEYGGAWEGDRVQIEQLACKQNDRVCYRVVSVLERTSSEVVGVLVWEEEGYLVKPIDWRKCPIVIDNPEAAQPGDRVSVRIQSYGDTKHLPRGTVQCVFGREGSMQTSIASILHENGVEEQFAHAVEMQTEQIPQAVTEHDLLGRLDLRDKLIFTIDGDDAKDFDDAVSLERLDNGNWLLGVHIADVSHYVTPESALDREAFRRGTSVYYPGHVVPMLPFALSHGICSLNPDVDRLTFSALIEFDAGGGRHHTRFAKSVIHSCARMTYRKVNQILAGDPLICTQYAFLVDTLRNMNSLSHTLQRRRAERGALELELPEIEVVLDETGEPIHLQNRERGDGECLIESFMLAANEAVAAYMQTHGHATVYRVHEPPNPEKLRAFAQIAGDFGYKIDAGKPEDSAQLQAVLRGAQNDPRQRALPMLLLRSLARARYADTCIGHYGLRAKFYLHFTSPIRRYPDLIAHRMLQRALMGEDFGAAEQSMCAQAAEQSTVRELAADTCEHSIEKLYIARFMKQYLGEEFEGEIAGIQSFGIFIALSNGCEGLLRIELLGGDYYVYDERHMQLIGQHTGRRFSIGMPMRVRLIGANDVNGQIDFAPSGLSYPTPTSPSSLRAPSSPHKSKKASDKKRAGKKGKKKKNTHKKGKDRLCLH